MNDGFDLDRFVAAQAPVIDQAFDELRAGRKRNHWMWFVFPQIAGLGFSAMARRYAIGSREEAEAYGDHPILGARLRTGTAIVDGLRETSAATVFGSPDDMKFRSCMTLFAAVMPGEPLYHQALTHYFGGVADAATLKQLRDLDANPVLT